ncbi:carbonic anhydrase [Sporosarcina pasteurii]|uniref:Carbonic anhydrase n=1 Tax=Sporosarcina pasteurii TaxID=1474 RepID=A0A380CBW1_SPOPA|nr:carbonic anhydrase family protein [Sporosarcina pasteurii]MDS9473153.1 carbonic anhydrase family protein [Sporosarcina pasteurii]QBQ06994.1 carbonic anhydrase family protein [Sporosarcina pasteurii]SUJ17485.1 Carbonic anhydrase precursor [Sporosarcina pasteurii]
MKKKIVYPFLAVSLLLGACSEQTTETTEPEKEEVAHIIENEETDVTSTAQWAYDADIGPDHWGELDNSYGACMNGSEQSPINIESTQVKTSEELENIDIQYESTQFSIMNTGHAVQANPATTNNSILVEGKEYTLAQFHFHTPSEHQLNSQYFDMELHLVHQDANGDLAVLGVMIQEGEENEALASIWGVLPENETEEDVDVEEAIDLQALLPSNQKSFHYNGSLTTPPCAEAVKWIVFEEPIEMSKEQIQAYQEIFPDNQRPVQPLNDREIFGLN